MNKFKIGFGMMRLPVQSDGAIDYPQSCAMVDEYLNDGEKYFDTSYIYQGGHNEEIVRKVLMSTDKAHFAPKKLPRLIGSFTPRKILSSTFLIEVLP